MKTTNQTLLTFLTLVILLGSCCVRAKVDHLGNHLYLYEYDCVDRRIPHQTKRCDISGVEIVPMTVMAISYNHYGKRTTDDYSAQIDGLKISNY